ncbi:DUF2971 domain-containing protein [Kineococcus sp. NUM-3379]
MADEGEHLLWHYTDLATLMAMVEGEEAGRIDGTGPGGDRVPCLWAAHFEYLNDSREFHYARDLLRRALADLDAEGDGGRREALRRIRAELDEPRAVEPAGGPFIVCLSSAEDSLSQWRGYGMSRRSVGCAIGFDEHALEELGAERHLVRYLGEEQGARWIRENLPWFRDGEPDGAGRTEHDVEQELYYDLFGYSAQLKHVSFADEQEERFVWRQDGSHRLHFRTSQFGMTPYVKVPFPRLRQAVRRIRIAPNPYEEHARVAVSAWAADAVGEHVRVLPSESPFRGW